MEILGNKRIQRRPLPVSITDESVHRIMVVGCLRMAPTSKNGPRVEQVCCFNRGAEIRIHPQSQPRFFAQTHAYIPICPHPYMSISLHEVICSLFYGKLRKLLFAYWMLGNYIYIALSEHRIICTKNAKCMQINIRMLKYKIKLGKYPK